jgi:hypothetical protein
MQIAGSRESSRVYERDLLTRKLRHWFIASQHHKSHVCNVTCHAITNQQQAENVKYSYCVRICAPITRRAMYMGRAFAKIYFMYLSLKRRDYRHNLRSPSCKVSCYFRPFLSGPQNVGQILAERSHYQI